MAASPSYPDSDDSDGELRYLWSRTPTPEAIKPPPYTEELKMRIVGEEVGFDGEIRCA